MTTSTSAFRFRRRDAAVGRIDRITTGTAVVAVAATAGFGVLAAFTYSGQPAAASAAAASAAAATSEPVAGAIATDDEPVARLPTANSGSRIGSQLQPAPAAPRAASAGSAQVTTGGSR